MSNNKFADIDQMTTDFANLVNVGLKEKLQLKHQMTQMVTASCNYYVTDQEFKNDVDAFNRLYVGK